MNPFPAHPGADAEKPEAPDHELIRCIGQGSYGQVWLARTLTGSWRALKVVCRHPGEDHCFKREYEGLLKYEPLSRTDTAHVSIFHVGRDPGGEYFYYSMELADDLAGAGGVNPDTYVPATLRERLRQHRRLPVGECLRIGMALAKALDNLHRHGLVHRDVKPSNIIFVGGETKLADIGLVTHADASASFVGTEGYVAPEGPGSAAADLYSLGKVLYEISTGMDRQDFPELPTDLPDRPDRNQFLALNDLISRICARDPRRRCASATRLHADLLRLAAGQSTSVRRASRRRSLAIGMAACLILAAGGGFLASRFSRPVQPASRASHTPAPLALNAEAGRRVIHQPVVRVACRNRHAFAVLSDGRILAWGGNEYGQLGIGTLKDSFVPVLFDDRGVWRQVEPGDNFSAGIQRDGSLWTWGNNEYGQLGIGSPASAPNPVRVGTDLHWASLQAGQHSVFATKDDGSLWCWGRNDLGQLGLGTTNLVMTPSPMAAPGVWLTLAASYEFTAGIKTGHTLWAWGGNHNGQLATPNLALSGTPVLISDASQWRAVTAGLGHAVALRSDGSLWSWGHNQYALGRGSQEEAVFPLGQIGTDHDWQAVSAGLYHTLALKRNGSLWVWGAPRIVLPVEVINIDNPHPVFPSHEWSWIPPMVGEASFVLKKDGSLWAWGNNGAGQLGDGTRLDQIRLVRVLPTP